MDNCPVCLETPRSNAETGGEGGKEHSARETTAWKSEVKAENQVESNGVSGVEELIPGSAEMTLQPQEV